MTEVHIPFSFTKFQDFASRLFITPGGSDRISTVFSKSGQNFGKQLHRNLYRITTDFRQFMLHKVP